MMLECLAVRMQPSEECDRMILNAMVMEYFSIYFQIVISFNHLTVHTMLLELSHRLERCLV